MEFLSLEMSDEYSCRARLWNGADSPRSTAIVIHGIQSHGGWYEGTGQYLSRSGISVLMPDRRGSGDNEIQRGHTPSVSQLIDDLTRWTDFARSQWSTARVHLIGISWGGKLAAALAHRLPDRIATLSLVTPGIYAKADISLMDKARVAGSLIFGSSRRFPIPLNDPRLFTDDACWIGFITEDTRRLIDATARLLWASKKLDRRSRRRIPVHIPTQLMLAENDRIVDNRMLSGWFRRQTGDRRRLIIYQAALHTLEFGSAAEQYREDLAEWIKLAETD